MSKPLVVITGASAGIGAAIARAFSAAGHPLLLLARRVEPMQALALPDTLCIGVDVTDTAAMKAAILQAEALAARDRAACGPVCPPQGLYLTGVGYPRDPFAQQ